jgi:hypothetical protein
MLPHGSGGTCQSDARDLRTRSRLHAAATEALAWYLLSDVAAASSYLMQQVDTDGAEDSK